MVPPHARLESLEGGDLSAAIVERREDQWLERKGPRVTPRALAETLVAMANAEGGTIVIGVQDRNVVGVDAVDQNDWRQASVNYTEPPVRHRYVVREVPGPAGSVQVALLVVDISNELHRMTSGEVFLRIGDENRSLSPLQIQELEYDKGQSSFDGRPVGGTTFDDLDPGLVTDYYRAIAASGPPGDVLEARGMVVRREGKRVPTTAGVLLFHRTPQQYFPEAWIRVLAYRGRTREVGSRANATEDERFEGNLAAQVDGSRAFLRRLIPATIRLEGSGRFERAPVIPESVWGEALVNAAIHRSYSMGGDHIRIEVFDDRVEVESPGRLPGLVRLETIRSTRFARNPRIARVMADFGYGRELGEGVDRMFQDMERAGLPDPVFVQRPASLLVNLVANPEQARELRMLPARLERLVEAMRSNGRLTTADAMRLSGQSRPTVLRHLALLVERGLIEHVGPARDPQGYWRLRR